MALPGDTSVPPAAAARAPAEPGVSEALLTVLGEDRAAAIALVQPLMLHPTPVPPTRVFDNLYYLGTDFVGAWAITTSDGILLIDALNTWREAEDLIEGGLRAVGLDPAQTRRVVVMHGHGDHYGGAKYLQDKFGAAVYMSAADWDFAPRWLEEWTAAGGPAAAAMFGAIPARDGVVGDGEQLTLGNTTLTLYATPGHTPGTLSAIIPVTDQGRPHTLSLWGGTALPEDRAGRQAYRDSVERYLGVVEAAHVDGVISAHPFIEETLEKIARLQTRRPGEPHPFVIGHAAAMRYMQVHRERAEAALLR